MPMPISSTSPISPMSAVSSIEGLTRCDEGYSGHRSPGERSHSLMWEPVSALPCFAN